MLFAIQYMCDKCKYVQVITFLRKKVKSFSESPQYVICPKCRYKKMERMFSGCTFHIAETDGLISSKPDSYFANAEWNAQRNRKKKAEDAMEKLYYSNNKDKVRTNRMPDQKDL